MFFYFTSVLCNHAQKPCRGQSCNLHIIAGLVNEFHSSDVHCFQSYSLSKMLLLLCEYPICDWFYAMLFKTERSLFLWLYSVLWPIGAAIIFGLESNLMSAI